MRGKQNLFLLIAIGSIILEMLFLFYGYEQTWRLWNIPTMLPHFSRYQARLGNAYPPSSAWRDKPSGISWTDTTKQSLVAS